MFTWGWERDLYAMPPQSTEVEVSLEPDGDGTLLRLTHRSVPTGAIELHRGGWQHYLPRLATVAAGGDAGAGLGPVPVRSLIKMSQSAVRTRW